MICTYYTLDGNEVEDGQYCPLTKSIYQAMIDSGYPEITSSPNGKWILVGEGKIRMVISND